MNIFLIDLSPFEALQPLRQGIILKEDIKVEKYTEKLINSSPNTYHTYPTNPKFEEVLK